MSSPFGPSALATPANAVTLARLLVAPVLVGMVVILGPSWWTASAWAVMAGTDWLDGWIARRQGATRSGAFLDPLADKFLVIGALVGLVVIGGLWWLPVALIAFRELGMSVYRSWAGHRGVSVPARTLAKAKTWAQALAIAAALVPPVADHARIVVVTILWIAVALTLWTGTLYWLAHRRARRLAPSATGPGSSPGPVSPPRGSVAPSPGSLLAPPTSIVPPSPPAEAGDGGATV